MGEQGCLIKDNVLYEDNQSKTLMLKNGRNLCKGKSRHVHIQYFFVKNTFDKGEIRVEYCPLELMLADFLQSHYKDSYSRISEIL